MIEWIKFVYFQAGGMSFREYVQSPEVTMDDPAAIYKLISGFNRVEIVFSVDEKNERTVPMMKTYPLGENDPTYLSLKKHFQVGPDFFIIENVPYKDLPAAAVKIGAKVGMMFLSKGIRMGGYGTVVKQVEKSLVNKGSRLAGKGALFVTFPKPLQTVNRRQRFRLYPRVEDLYCEIAGYAVNRAAPVPTFPVRNLADFGASILMLNVPEEHWPEVGDILFVRISLFTPAKGYGLKRGVVVSLEEITSGHVTQQQFVFKSKVIHRQRPNERALEVGMQFLEHAREGVSVETKQFPRLTYLPIDPKIGIEAVQSWCIHIQQLRRSEEKEKGIL